MIIPLFPVLLHEFAIPDFKDIEKNLIKTSYHQRKKDPKGRVVSNRGGWQSSFIQEENNIIRSTLLRGIRDYGESNQIFECDLILSSLWININGKGDYNELHHHPSCDLSGVFWIKTPENSGKLQFVNPNNFSQHTFLNSFQQCVRNTYLAHLQYDMDLVPGRIVLFPSHLLHGVEPSQSREDRISISFNIKLTEPEKDEEEKASEHSDLINLDDVDVVV